MQRKHSADCLKSCNWRRLYSIYLQCISNLHLTKVNFNQNEILKHCVYAQDSSYVQQLSIPMAGLTLKTRVFAAVKASNLDRRYSINLFHLEVSTEAEYISISIHVVCYHSSSAKLLDYFNGNNAEQYTGL